MDLLKKKIADADNIFDLFNDYYERVAPLLEEHYNTESVVLGKIINEYSGLKTKLVDSINKDSQNISDIFELYSNYQNLFLVMENVINYIHKPHLLAENIDNSLLSQTYKLETADVLSHLSFTYRLFSKKHDIEEKLLENLSDKIFNLEDDDKLEHLQNEFRKNKNTVSLYAAVLQKILDTDRPDGKRADVFYINNMIESDKTFFIEGVAKNTLDRKHRNIHNTNPPMKTFGFIPVTDSMPINKLVHIMINKQTSGKINLAKYAAANNVCFIKLNHVVFNPVEYNLRRIIIPEEAEQYSQPEEYGVTSRVIEQYKTIDQLPESKWNFSYEIIGKTTANLFYVMETIDGVNYRALAPWIRALGLGLPLFRVRALLEYIQGSNKPDRVTNYHQSTINKSIPNMFIPRKLDMEKIDYNAQDVNINLIQNEVYVAITNLIKTIIKKEFSKGIRSNADINRLIHDIRIKEKLHESMLSMFNIGSNVTRYEFSAGLFPFHEILSAYVVDLQYMCDRFMRELHDGYNRNTLPDEVFEQKDNTVVLNKIDEVVLSVIQMLITSNDNVYMYLNYKYMILNFS